MQKCIMKLFQTIYLFFDGKYKADADLMIGDMTDDGDDDKFHQHVIKHAKGFGECALLCLQVFVTRELFYHVADIWRLAPTPARRASKKQTFRKF